MRTLLRITAGHIDAWAEWVTLLWIMSTHGQSGSARRKFVKTGCLDRRVPASRGGLHTLEGLQALRRHRLASSMMVVLSTPLCTTRTPSPLCHHVTTLMSPHTVEGHTWETSRWPHCLPCLEPLGGHQLRLNPTKMMQDDEYHHLPVAGDPLSLAAGPAEDGLCAAKSQKTARNARRRLKLLVK